MSRKVAFSLLALLVVTAGFVALAAAVDTTQEIAVQAILDGQWPELGLDPDAIARREVVLTGWVGRYDPRHPRELFVCGVCPPHDGPLPPVMRVVIRHDAILPEDLVREAEVFLKGTYDPREGVVTAFSITAKCPSARRVQAEPEVRRDA